MTVPAPFEPVDVRITGWMARHGITFTRIALGIVFFWFGVIKFVPEWSPASDLATRTIAKLTGGAIAPALSLKVLAGWEGLIGLGLLTGKLLRIPLLMLFLQVAWTMLPLICFQDGSFRAFPYAPTLEGQYIIRNLVLIAAAIVVGATVRGGRLKP